MSVLGSVSFLINAIILVESKDATYLFCFTSSFRSQRWFGVCIYKCTLTTRNQTKHLHFLYIASGFAEQIHLSSHHFRLITLQKNHPRCFHGRPFFPAVTRLTWPGLEWMTCQAGKKKRGKTGKAGTPQKSWRF